LDNVLDIQNILNPPIVAMVIQFGKMRNNISRNI